MLRISIFGPTSVVTHTGTLTAADLGGVKPRQILELLALSAGTPVPKDRLADLLWEGAPPKMYVGTLESYVCVLRRRLGLAGGRRSVLATTSSGYLLDAGQATVDLVEFRRLLSLAAVAAPAVSVELTTRALAMAGSTLLVSDEYARWATEERICVQQELATVCVGAADHALRAGDYDTALRLARAVTERDRFAERAVQQVMRSLWLSGRRCEALRTYADLRRAIVEELGLEPGRATHSLYLEILRDEAPSGVPAADQDRTELSTLLGLLRQTLQAIPGVQLPRTDGTLAEIAVRVLSAA